MTDRSHHQPSDRTAGEPDPLRTSWTSATWAAVTGLAVLLVLLIVFIAQNTRSVAVRFLGWTWHPPLAVALLAAVAVGLLLAVCAGTLRILQLRRRVRRSKRAAKAAQHEADQDETSTEDR